MAGKLRYVFCGLAFFVLIIVFYIAINIFKGGGKCEINIGTPSVKYSCGSLITKIDGSSSYLIKIMKIKVVNNKVYVFYDDGTFGSKFLGKKFETGNLLKDKLNMVNINMDMDYSKANYTYNVLDSKSLSTLNNMIDSYALVTVARRFNSTDITNLSFLTDDQKSEVESHINYARSVMWRCYDSKLEFSKISYLDLYCGNLFSNSLIYFNEP